MLQGARRRTALTIGQVSGHSSQAISRHGDANQLERLDAYSLPCTAPPAVRLSEWHDLFVCRNSGRRPLHRCCGRWRRRCVAEITDGATAGPPDYGMVKLGSLPPAWQERDLTKPFPLTEAWVWEGDERPDEELRPLLEPIYNHGSLVLGTDGCLEYWHLIVRRGSSAVRRRVRLHHRAFRLRRLGPALGRGQRLVRRMPIERCDDHRHRPQPGHPVSADYADWHLSALRWAETAGERLHHPRTRAATRRRNVNTMN